MRVHFLRFSANAYDARSLLEQNQIASATIDLITRTCEPQLPTNLVNTKFTREPLMQTAIYENTRVEHKYQTLSQPMTTQYRVETKYKPLPQINQKNNLWP